MNDTPATVMVVDDVPANLKLLRTHLGESGYNVAVFSDGHSALQAALQEPPDIILLDINMPEYDGFQVCTQLKNDERLRDIPVLFISALDELENKVKAFEAGGVDFVTKPFQVHELRARVATHLELRRREAATSAAFEELKQLEQLRDSLVHMIVHDLRSPLAGVLSVFQLLEGERNPALIDEYSAVGIQATQKIMNLVENILGVSKLESGQLQVHCAREALGELLASSTEGLRRFVESRVLTVQDTDSDVTVECDAEIVARIVANLVWNAVAFTDPHDGAIEVRARVERDTVRIEVEDNGEGVPEAFREQIFEKFSQAPGSRRSTGLGLAFCRLAVEAHGGRIGVEARPQGGSVFWFTLPLAHAK